MNNVTFNSDKVFVHKQWKKQIFKYTLEKGSIVMMPKPVGGIQLESYVQFLKSQRIDIVVSLLEFDEINHYDLVNEGSESQKVDIEFINFPIKDHSVPHFFMPFNQLISKLTKEVNVGKNIAIHCYAGIGRTGVTAASILIKQGMRVDNALIDLSQARGLRVPETLEQISWLHHYSEQLQE